MNLTNAELIRIIEIASRNDVVIAIEETEHELKEAIQLTATLAACALARRIAG